MSHNGELKKKIENIIFDVILYTFFGKKNEKKNDFDLDGEVKREMETHRTSIRTSTDYMYKSLRRLQKGIENNDILKNVNNTNQKKLIKTIIARGVLLYTLSQFGTFSNIYRKLLYQYPNQKTPGQNHNNYAKLKTITGFHGDMNPRVFKGFFTKWKDIVNEVVEEIKTNERVLNKKSRSTPSIMEYQLGRRKGKTIMSELGGGVNGSIHEGLHNFGEENNGMVSSGLSVSIRNPSEDAVRSSRSSSVSSNLSNGNSLDKFLQVQVQRIGKVGSEDAEEKLKKPLNRNSKNTRVVRKNKTVRKVYKGKNGGCYVLRRSKRTGNVYKKYL